MSKTRTWRARSTRVLLFVFAVPLVFLSLGCGRHGTSKAPFPEKTQERVILKPAQSGEDIRYVNHWPDGQTIMSVRIERKNGETEYRSYRHDGSAREFREYFPAAKGALVEERMPSSSPWEFNTTHRQLKSHMVFSDNGRQLVTLEEFRPDGTRESTGKLLPDKTFQKLNFNVDGLTLKSDQIFAADGILIAERAYAQDGSKLTAETRRLADNKTETRTYREDGTLNTILVRAFDGSEEIDFFRPDGKTRYMTVLNSAWSVEAIYYLPSGEPDHKRKFQKSGSVEVVKYIPGTGKMGPFGAQMLARYGEQYSQEWTCVDTGKGDCELRLSSVTVYDKNGKMSRKYIFNAAKNALSKIWFYEDGFNTHDRIFRDDGTLERIDYFEKGKPGVQRSENVAQEKGIREKIDGRYFKQLPFEDPRPLIKPIEPPPPSHDDSYIDD